MNTKGTKICCLTQHPYVDFINGSNWTRLGEGNEHVVFNWNCINLNPFCMNKRYVLRLKKKVQFSREYSSKLKIIGDAEIQKLIYSEHYLVSSRFGLLTQSALEKLMPQYINKGKALTIYDSKQCKSIEQNQCQAGSLLPNYLYFPPSFECWFKNLDPASVICIEIKPKWGSLPVSNNVHPVKKLRCRFCMHQHLKFVVGKYPCLSKYCPLDLYSKDRDRVSYAISSLYETPQNNLKIFHQDQLVWPRRGRGSTSSSTVATPQLSKDMSYKVLHTSEDRHNCIELDDTTDKFLVTSFDFQQQCLIHIFLRDPVLMHLKLLQRFDECDIEEIWKLIEPFWNTESKTINFELLKEYNNSNNNDKPSNLTDILSDFIVSTSAKDCSVMVTITEINPKQIPSDIISIQKYIETYNLNVNTSEQVNAIDIEYKGQLHHVFYKVSVVDLQMKSLEKLERYHQLDLEIRNMYMSSNKLWKKKYCIQ